MGSFICRLIQLALELVNAEYRVKARASIEYIKIQDSDSGSFQKRFSTLDKCRALPGLFDNVRNSINSAPG